MLADTLFFPFESGLLQRPGAGVRALFLNARFCAGLVRFKPGVFVLQQGFKPFCAGLAAGGYTVVQDLPEDSSFDVVLLAAPQNRIEAEYLIACALRVLKPGGFLIAAADNKAGGGRLAKMLEDFGLRSVHSESKNKARIVWACKERVDEGCVHAALEAGGVQPVLGGAFLSRPGLYGWDKEDRGSALLCRSLPVELAGRGADFGCGYGYLSAHVLRHCAGVKSLVCADADFRAVALCRANLAAFEDRAALSYAWADLTVGCPEIAPGALDFVVMNPPFHEGKKTDSGIGKAFIATVARALRKGGTLYMVANAHLPYEADLRAVFSTVESLCEEGGFKVLRAVK